jgi:hypothetical protein
VCACIPGGRGRRASTCRVEFTWGIICGYPCTQQTRSGSAPGRRPQPTRGTAPRASRPRLMPPDPFPPNSHSLRPAHSRSWLDAGHSSGGTLGAAPVRAPGSRPARAARGSRGGRSTLQRPRLRLSTPAAEGLERGSNGTQAGPRITGCATPGGAGARTSASHAQQRPPHGADERHGCWRAPLAPPAPCGSPVLRWYRCARYQTRSEGTLK